MKVGLGKYPNPVQGAGNTRLHGPNLVRFVLGTSHGERIGFTPHAIHPVDGSKRRVWANLGCRETRENCLNRQPDQRREGRRGAERPARPERPEGRAAERLPEAGACPRPGSRPARPRPAGGGHREGGAVAVGGAVYILHLRESTPRSDANHREKRSAGDFR